MDANFLRFLIEEASGVLQGARIENIYNPAPCLWTFKLSSRINLVFLSGKKKNFIFFSKNRPENPSVPTPAAMWWRKRIRNCFITDIENAWVGRQIFLSLSRDGLTLMLDLKEGPSLTRESICSYSPSWPCLSDIEEKRDLYKDYPHITSVLRYALLAIEEREERRRWYSKLREGEIDRFFLYEAEGPSLPIISLWPRKDLKEKGLKEKIFSSAMEVAEEYGFRVLKDVLVSGEEKRDRRKRRTLKRIERDLEKAKEMVKAGERARLIQEQLYRFSPSSRYKVVKIEAGGGEIVEIPLDPSLTLRENMELMFKRAKKGKRALAYLENRWREISQTQESIWNIFPRQSGEKDVSDVFYRKIILPKRFKGIKVKTFLSSDGFVIVRGKNQEANHKLITRACRPYDMWFHVQGGPGAHVILLRQNPRQEVPISTKLEAAQLAALASYERDSSKAQVLCSEVRYVKPSKHRALGEVDVIKVLETFVVDVDPSIEERLMVEVRQDR